MGARRDGRVYALQLLYQADINRLLESGDSVADIFLTLGIDEPVDEGSRRFAHTIAHGVQQELSRIDKTISEASTKWRVDRMAVIDRNILRLATYEMIAEADTAPAIIINEAVEIAKAYGDETAACFINGVLDKVSQLLRPG